jgi:hypothetical protein
MDKDSADFSWGVSEDLDAPFSSMDRQNSADAKSFRSVQTSFTKKGMGWECKSCRSVDEMYRASFHLEALSYLACLLHG